MTQPNSHITVRIAAVERPCRTNADYRWTKEKVFAFLDALARHASVAGAAREVGMSRQSAYRLRARLGPGFGAVWDEGVALARLAGRGSGLQGDNA